VSQPVNRRVNSSPTLSVSALGDKQGGRFFISVNSLPGLFVSRFAGDGADSRRSPANSRFPKLTESAQFAIPELGGATYCDNRASRGFHHRPRV
jgi:hypothetical protein